MLRVISVKALPGHRLDVEFSDGTRGGVDCSADLWGPLFAPLRDPERFAEVGVDEYGAVCWPNGADMAPDAIHEEIRRGTPAAR
jgi:hypothetical protein